MISDRELWACAQKVIHMHGEHAAVHAARRADELLEAGDLEGQRTWQGILARIEDLLSTTPEAVH